MTCRVTSQSGDSPIHCRVHQRFFACGRAQSELLNQPRSEVFCSQNPAICSGDDEDGFGDISLAGNILRGFSPISIALAVFLHSWHRLGERTNVRKADVTCACCGAGFRRLELWSEPGAKGEYHCPVCDYLLEAFDGTNLIAYRLTIQPVRAPVYSVKQFDDRR